MARKGLYSEWIEGKGLDIVQGWALAGLTDADIAHNIGISVSTLYEWKNRFPEFAEALKTSKDFADYQVENALYKRATGYFVIETTVEESDKDGKKVKTQKKYIAPDTTAQIFWLKNRQPQKWRDKPENYITDEFEDDGLLEALKAGHKLISDEVQ